MAAMVVGPKWRRLVNRTISRSLIGSQTTTRRTGCGQFLTAFAPVKRMSSSAKMLRGNGPMADSTRSEEHTSELQSRQYLVCRLLLEKDEHKCRYYSVPVPVRRPRTWFAHHAPI